MNKDSRPSVARILTFSTLYPNPQQPHHGIFVEQRLRNLLATREVTGQVVAPVPWFPLSSERFGDYACYTSIPKTENRHGIDIFHPRYLTLPKVGMTVAPWLMAKSLKSEIQKMLDRQFRFDLIDAHYFYPDGVAAAILARKLKVPLIITARGTDINLIPEHRIPRTRILWAAERASAIIAVSNALKGAMINIGIDGKKIHVLRNGVDLDLFKPIDQQRAREHVGNWTGRWLLSVGHLIERKGHHLTIEALCSLPDVSLAIAGDGPMRNELQALTERLGVARRVSFVGAVTQEELPYYYGAADAFVLASSREGMANVLLESIACGLPVVATPIWGTPEVVSAPVAGVLTKGRTPVDLSRGIEQLFGNYPDRKLTRAFAETFSWDRTTSGQLKIIYSIRGRH